MSANSKKRSPAAAVALVGISAAAIECGKLALMALPNIEVVTLLVALFSYSFGIYGLSATVIFVCIEPLIFGFGPWVILYFIYWPLLSLLFVLLGRAKIKNRVLITGIAVLCTFIFGILSALVEIGLFSGGYDNLFSRFLIYYTRGIMFYVLQIAANAILFPLLFDFLARRLSAVKKAFSIR